MNRKAIILFIIIVIFFSFILTLRINNTNRLYTKKLFLMDTQVEIKVKDSKKARKALNDTIEVMKSWDEKLNRYNEKSIISKINNNGEKGSYVSSEILSLIQTILDYSKKTDGAFDPTVAPLIDLWGFGESENNIPSSDEIKETFEKVGVSYLLVTEGDLNE